MRPPTERSSHRFLIELASTRTTELKSLTSTPGNRNARCADSNQRLRPNDFSGCTAQFTTCFEWDGIISKRSTIDCSGSELSLPGRRRRVPAEREKPPDNLQGKTASGSLT